MSQQNSTPPSNPKKIDYIVAHKWDESKPAKGNLAPFMGGLAEFRHDTLEEARLFLQYVRNLKPDEKWDLYKVTFSKLTVID